MNNSLKGNLLVLGQFILLGLLILYPSNSINYGAFALAVTIAIATLLAVGAVILGLSFLALGKSLTAHPIPAKQGELVTDGLYRFARHPIYTGVLAIGLAMTLSGGLFPHALFFIALVVLLNYKASFEEQLLRARYLDYASYAEKTGRFLPKLKR
jgi:protein-S-isoprenylcysteine O-methyltransferase Ste14